MSLTTVDGSLISSGAITLTTQVTGTLPVANGGTGVTTSTGTGAVVLGTSPSISGAVMSTMASSVLTSATAQATTSGTSIDFTSIPSWVKRITVMLNGVSTNGTSVVLMRIGAGTIITSGYASVGIGTGGGTIQTTSSTVGFVFANATGAADSLSTTATLVNITGNSWLWASTGQRDASTAGAIGSGTLALGGTLDRVRITTVNGTDTFDAGSINILYE